MLDIPSYELDTSRRCDKYTRIADFKTALVPVPSETVKRYRVWITSWHAQKNTLSDGRESYVYMMDALTPINWERETMERYLAYYFSGLTYFQFDGGSVRWRHGWYIPHIQYCSGDDMLLDLNSYRKKKTEVQSYHAADETTLHGQRTESADF